MKTSPPQQRFASTAVAQVLSGLVASACLAWAPTAALAQQTLAPSIPFSQPIPTSASPTASTLTELESQPDATQDLAVENLTADQVSQIESIFAAYQPQIDAAAIAYGQALSILNNLLVPETSDAAITQARDQAVTAQRTIDDLVYERNLALRAVLTLEQRQAINAYLRAWLDLGPADTAAAFPQTLVGLDASTASTQLQADGWKMVIETPGLLGFDRNDQQLDLDVGRDGHIATATLSE